MKKFVAVAGLCMLISGLMAGCSEDACEKTCDKLYDGSQASDCKDGCN